MGNPIGVRIVHGTPPVNSPFTTIWGGRRSTRYSTPSAASSHCASVRVDVTGSPGRRAALARDESGDDKHI